MQYRSMPFNCIHVYLIFEATDSKQYRPQNALFLYEVSTTNNLGFVSNSLERLAPASGCMSSNIHITGIRLHKHIVASYMQHLSKAVSTRHFSEPGAIDRDQFAPSCPCPHGSNRNARSGF